MSAFFITGSWFANTVNAPATFSTGVSPSPVNELAVVTINIHMNGGTAATTYIFRVTVTKPGGASVGQSYNSLSVLTNSTGGGDGAINYPSTSPAWTTVSGSPANTDVLGAYTVTYDETSPKSVTNVAPSTSFIVQNTLTVVILSPSPTVSIARGTAVGITADIRDLQNNPVSGATVSATTPTGSIQLSPSSPIGRYTNSYTIQQNDPIGNWNITVSAYYPSAGTNTGAASVIVTIISTQLIVSDLSTYNANGTPTSDFNPGDTLYASFRIAYSGTNQYLTTGSITVHVRTPSGTDLTTLVCIYDPNRGVFYTPSGFQVSLSDTAGTWFLVFPANSITDANNNTGPVTAVTYRFQIHQPVIPGTPSTINSIWYTIAAITGAAVLGSLVFLKRFNLTSGPFEDLFKLTGGEIQPPTTLMIISDSGAGSTTMALELLDRDLTKGRYCGLLSYDAFPSQIAKNMKDMGWDIAEYLKSGQLKIVDCYSANAGVEGGKGIIKDPTDFTEVSIQVTSLIDKAKGPLTLVLDSSTPIFSAAAAKDCINFLQVLGAKLKNSGGTFIFTATKGSVPEEARSKIESLADGVIELSLVKKATGLGRYLLVKKMAGRQSSSIETPFEIREQKGILIRKQRIPIGLFRP